MKELLSGQKGNLRSRWNVKLSIHFLRLELAPSPTQLERHLCRPMPLFYSLTRVNSVYDGGVAFIVPDVGIYFLPFDELANDVFATRLDARVHQRCATETVTRIHVTVTLKR